MEILKNVFQYFLKLQVCHPKYLGFDNASTLNVCRGHIIF